jgi:acyl-coenzyme A thioesterase PaaI-like protein
VVVHAGRSLVTIAVDVTGSDGRLASRALASFAAPEALAPVAREPSPLHGEMREAAWRETESEIPIVTTLAPRTGMLSDGRVATLLSVPWDDFSQHGAESICIPADMCVGPPVASGIPGGWKPHPNPDLSVRFAGAVTTRALLGAARLERIAGGVAVVSFGVYADGAAVAAGVSTSLVLPG